MAMLKGLDHYFIKAADLAASASFYEKALGLKRGKRPHFDFPGEWMYLGDKHVVHIGQVGYGVGPRPTGALGHIAFSGFDFAGQMKILHDAGIEVEVQTVPGERQHQIFFRDPDGIGIELNFPITE